MHRFHVWLAAAVSVAIVVGCGGAGDSASGGGEADDDSKVIGASLLTQRHIFYQDLTETLEAAAAEHGFTMRIQYAEFDSPRQFNQIENFINQQVDAIIVAPNDSEGVVPAIQRAVDAGIPVFTADIAAHNAPVTSHIASDNVEGGRIIGRYLAEELGGSGKVAIVDHPEVASVQDRTRGFDEAMADYPDITIVQRAPGGGVRDKALRAAQDVLQAHPDLDAIFGINDDSALGAMAAVESAGLSDQVIIVGYDGTPEAREAILAGTPLIADTVQYPREIGTTTIDIIAAHFRGEEVPAEVPVRVGIIDRETLQGGVAP